MPDAHVLVHIHRARLRLKVVLASQAVRGACMALSRSFLALDPFATRLASSIQLGELDSRRPAKHAAYCNQIIDAWTGSKAGVPIIPPFLGLGVGADITLYRHNLGPRAYVALLKHGRIAGRGIFVRHQSAASCCTS